MFGVRILETQYCEVVKKYKNATRYFNTYCTSVTDGRTDKQKERAQHISCLHAMWRAVKIIWDKLSSKYVRYLMLTTIKVTT